MAPATPAEAAAPYSNSKTGVDAEDAFVAKEQALRRAAANRCVIVVAGPPGGGKSTFIRSSLLPRLHKAGRRAALLQHKFAQEFGLSWGSDEWDDASRPVAFASVFDFGSGCICLRSRVFSSDFSISSAKARSAFSRDLLHATTSFRGILSWARS